MNDLDAMNTYMSSIASETSSYFDTGKRPSGEEIERCYHGFVLGLLVELEGRYTIASNRESGFGKYDVRLEPENHDDNASILLYSICQNPINVALL